METIIHMTMDIVGGLSPGWLGSSGPVGIPGTVGIVVVWVGDELWNQD